MDIEELKDKLFNYEIAGIPGKYITIGVLIIVFLGLVYLAMPSQGATGKLDISVKSGGKALEGASIKILANGELVKMLKSKTEPVSVNVPNGKVTVKISMKGYKDFEKEITVSGEKSLIASLEKLPPVLGGECITTAENLGVVKLMVDERPGKNCKVEVLDNKNNAVDLGWKVKNGYKVITSYNSENCPRKGYSVKIVCDHVSTTVDMSKFIMWGTVNGKVFLHSNTDETEKTKETKYVKTQNIYVTVKDTSGNPISGVKVKAVQKTGYPLALDYDNVITSGTTSIDGRTKLVLPDGQLFYLSAEDISGDHPPTGVTGPYNALGTLNINLTMKTGFKSNITVYDNDTNKPLPGATILVYNGSSLEVSAVSGTDGRAILNLKKGTYKAVINMDGYIPVKKDIEAGQDIKVTLTKLTDRNSAKVKIKVTNAHGFNEPIPGVQVQIEDTDGTVITPLKKTDDNGIADFGRIPVGAYIAYIPASDKKLESSTSKPFSVSAGIDQVVNISVVPPQVTLTVKTDVKGYPTTGVHVEVYNIKYNPIYPIKVGETDSEPPGEAEFQLDQGSVVYLNATFIDPRGKQFGPMVSPPITITGDTNYTIDLSEMTLNQTANLIEEGVENTSILNGTAYLDTGKNAYLILPVNMPYYNPSDQTPFDKVIVEAFAGEPGSLNDPNRTPIIIRDITSLDLQTTTNVKNILVQKSGTIVNYEPSGISSDTGMHTSKYIRITLSNYTSQMIYTLKIPLRVRAVLNKTNTHIYFRTTWIKGDSVYTSNNGNWQVIPVEISAHSSWKTIGYPQFYAYRAWLSQDVLGKTQINTTTDGSEFYLQIDAVARVDAETWTIPWDIQSGQYVKIIPISYSGYIVKSNGQVQTIYPVRLNSTSNYATGTGLSAEDRVHLAIKFLVLINTSGMISTSIPAEIDLFNSRESSITLNVIPLPNWERTNIPNLLYKESVFAYFNDSGQWVRQLPDENGKTFIGTFSWKTNKPREFAIVYKFVNSGENKTIRIVAQDKHYEETGQPYARFLEPIIISSWNPTEYMPTIAPKDKLDFTFQVNKSESKTVVILGIGTPELLETSSYIDVYMGLANESSVKLWKAYPHGPLDYRYIVIDPDGKPPVPGETGKLKITVIKQEYENGILHNKTISPIHIKYHGILGEIGLFGSALTQPTIAEAVHGQDYFIADVYGKLVPGELWLMSTGDEYGKLVEIKKLGGLEFIADSDRFVWNATDLYIHHKANSTTIIIINSGDSPASIAFWWSPSEPRAFNIYTEYTVENAWQVINNSSTSVIPPHGQMQIKIVGGASNICSRSENNYTFVVRGTTGNESTVKYYRFVFKCSSNNTVGKIGVPVREPFDLQDMDLDSCSSNGFVSRICDADQFVNYLVLAARQVYESGVPMTFYANLGNEVKLTVDQMNNIAHMINAEIDGKQVYIDTTGGHEGAVDIIFPGYQQNLTCGIEQFTMERTPQGDVQVTNAMENSSAPWCQPGPPSFFVGAMNPDKYSRGRYMGLQFTGDHVQEFVNATLKAMSDLDMVPSYLYGYISPSDIMSVFGSQGSAQFIYREETQPPIGMTCEYKKTYENGYEFCLNKGGQIYPVFTLDFIIPNLNYSEEQNASQLDHVREQMAKDLVSYWFPGITTNTPFNPLHVEVTSPWLVDHKISTYNFTIWSNMQLDEATLEINSKTYNLEPAGQSNNGYIYYKVTPLSNSANYTLTVANDTGGRQEETNWIVVMVPPKAKITYKSGEWDLSQHDWAATLSSTDSDKGSCLTLTPVWDNIHLPSPLSGIPESTIAIPQFTEHLGNGQSKTITLKVSCQFTNPATGETVTLSNETSITIHAPDIHISSVDSDNLIKYTSDTIQLSKGGDLTITVSNKTALESVHINSGGEIKSITGGQGTTTIDANVGMGVYKLTAKTTKDEKAWTWYAKIITDNPPEIKSVTCQTQGIRSDTFGCHTRCTANAHDPDSGDKITLLWSTDTLGASFSYDKTKINSNSGMSTNTLQLNTRIARTINVTVIPEDSYGVKGDKWTGSFTITCLSSGGNGNGNQCTNNSWCVASCGSINAKCIRGQCSCGSGGGSNKCVGCENCPVGTVGVCTDGSCHCDSTCHGRSCIDEGVSWT